MHDLVTGGTGFIGSHLARALVARGNRVRVLLRPGGRTDRLAGIRLAWCEGDLLDRESLDRAVTGVRRVFHCAALVTDWADPDAFRAANVTGVGNLLAACRDEGVRRLVHLSTTDVYGFPDRPVAEDAPYRYRGWPYGDTKIDGEKLVWAEARGSGLPVTVIRPTNVYGPGSESFVGEIADRLHDRTMVRIGRPRPAGLCHVDNLVDCICRAAERPRAVGEAYNVHDGGGVSWAAFADLLADALEEPRPRFTLPRRAAYAAAWCQEKFHRSRSIPRPPALTRMAVEILGTDQSFSIAKARRHLDYRPGRQAREAMPELVRWVREERP